MTKKTSPSQVEEPKEKTPNIAGALNQLASAIRQLEKKMSDEFTVLKQRYPLNEFKTDTTSDGSEKKEEKVEAPLPVESTIPFPVEWRSVIDEVLNKSFDAKVKYLDSASFELSIFVPKEYSNATKQEWDMYKADPRIKIIPNYQGIQGVRLFVDDIAKQLGDERRIKINDDRAKLINA